MPHRRDHEWRAQKIGFMASVLALDALGLVILRGNYLPLPQALFLFAVAGVLTLLHGHLCQASFWNTR
jgi:hypothetical protein